MNIYEQLAAKKMLMQTPQDQLTRYELSMREHMCSLSAKAEAEMIVLKEFYESHHVGLDHPYAHLICTTSDKHCNMCPLVHECKMGKITDRSERMAQDLIENGVVDLDRIKARVEEHYNKTRDRADEDILTRFKKRMNKGERK